MKIELDTEGFLQQIVAVVKDAVAGAPIPAEKYWFSMEDCANAWGFAKTYFYTRKYLLPNYGVFDDPERKRFSKETFISWIGKTLTEHERAWASLTSSERRQITKRREEK